MAQSKQSVVYQQKSFRELPKELGFKIAFMPIKPVYAERIISKEKTFEFRKSPISFDLTHLIIYASSPIQKILGIIKVNRVWVASPQDTWKYTKKSAGIIKQDFNIYFSDRAVAYSIELEPESLTELNRKFSPKEIDPNFQVPQSFKYVDIEFLEKVLELGDVDTKALSRLFQFYL